MLAQVIIIFALLAVGLLAGAGAVRILIGKHRGVWRELFHLREEVRSLRNKLTSVHKEAIRAGIAEATRLPLLLPSQGGEDIILWNFFDRKRDGFYIDVGAYDGVTFSNTYFFEAIGWTGILIEPNPDFFESCRSRRPYSRVVHAAMSGTVGEDQTTLHIASGAANAGLETLSFVGDNPSQVERIRRASGHIRNVSVPCGSIDHILGDRRGPIDFVSIDVEGSELDVLRGFDVTKYQPQVIVVEDNSGGRDKRVGVWLGERGYIERYRCEQNVFYTRRDDSRAFE